MFDYIDEQIERVIDDLIDHLKETGEYENTLILFFSVLGALILGTGIYFYRYEKQRTEKLKKISELMGLAFYPKGDQSLIDRLSEFHLFSQGYSGKIKNMLHGQIQQAEIAIFGYQYKIRGSRSSPATLRQTVIYFHSSSLNLPRFALRPEQLFHKIGQVIGYQDVDFESHPMFLQRYLLRAYDEKGVRRVFTDQVLSYFEQQRGVSTEGDGEQLIFYAPESRLRLIRCAPLWKRDFGCLSCSRNPRLFQMTQPPTGSGSDLCGRGGRRIVSDPSKSTIQP